MRIEKLIFAVSNGLQHMHNFYLKGALAPAIVCLNLSYLGSSDKPVQHRIESMMNIEYDSIPISLISILSDHFDMGFKKVCETKNSPSKITSIRVTQKIVDARCSRYWCGIPVSAYR